MTLVANGWDGVWSSVIGGFLSAATVVVGVFLAQHLSDTRKQRDERRATADALLLEVANARDAAVHSRSKARAGAYDLWPLRHQIYLSHDLRGLPIIQAVQNYYDAVWELRDWVRHGPTAHSDPASVEPHIEQTLTEHQRAVANWADYLVDALRDLATPLDDVVVHGPPRPLLPN